MRAAALVACLAVFALAAAAARAERGAALAVPEPGSYALPPLGAAGDGAVLETDGGATTLHALFEDKVVLLAFVYGGCGDADGCPLAHAVFHRLGRLLAGAASARLRILSLSFDPQRDTPQAMARLAASLAQGGLDWRFLTTASADALRPILDAYGQAVVQERDAQGRENGRIAHALRVFLIDAQGRIRNVYGSSLLEAELVQADVRTLLAEESAPAMTTRTEPETELAAPLLARIETPPLGLPALALAPDDVPTAATLALGRKLFFDRRLSANGTLSCASCHVPEQGFTSNAQRTAVGIEGRSVRRNAPTLYNAAHRRALFHDGRADRLDVQVWDPLLARNEMGNASADAVLTRLRAEADYAGLFEAAYPRLGVTRESVGRALADYERSLVSGGSPFDRWRFGGESDALGAAALRGFELFTARAGCSGCHLVGDRTAQLSDDAFHNTGVGAAEAAPGDAQLAGVIAQVGEPAAPDLGRYEITRNPADRWRYRTPSLRNVALTAPYMHDGSLATLDDVVDFYDRGGVPNPGLDPRIRPLALRAQEREDLVAFLRALTGGDVEALLADARAAPIGNPGDGAGGL